MSTQVADDGKKPNTLSIKKTAFLRDYQALRPLESIQSGFAGFKLISCFIASVANAAPYVLRINNMLMITCSLSQSADFCEMQLIGTVFDNGKNWQETINSLACSCVYMEMAQAYLTLGNMDLVDRLSRKQILTMMLLNSAGIRVCSYNNESSIS